MAIKRTRESEEMYLETILLLHKGQPNVRAVDVRDELGFAKSSVSRGVNLLEKKGYIHIDRDTGNLSFTDAGRKKAELNWLVSGLANLWMMLVIVMNKWFRNIRLKKLLCAA